MNNVIQDKYILGESQSKKIQSVGEEIRLDLDLHVDYKNKIGAIIQGTVKDSYNMVIKDALIKLMSEDYQPITQTKSDNNGKYYLQNIPLKFNMKLYATARGKILQKGILVNPREFNIITINFILEDNPSNKFGIIAGDVFDSTTNNPIIEAMISLFYIDDTSNEMLSSIIYTNEYGQFIFRDVPLGNYSIRISAKSYKILNVLTRINNNGQIVSLKNLLEKRPSIYSGGIISGVIKDKNGEVVQNANVVLYKFQVNEQDTPVDFTITNSEGVYYFNNIPQGDYKIKCTELSILDINEPVVQQGILSPNFYKFIISEASTFNPVIVNASGGSFSSNNISIVNNFVSGIGGPNKDSIKLIVNLPTSGMYILGIQYVSAIDTTLLKFNVNGQIFTDVLAFAQTNSWNLSDAQIFYVMLNLNQGDNTIKFYNDTGDYAPYIGDLYFKLYSKIYETRAANGFIGGNAYINNISGMNFVQGIYQGGYVEVELNSSIKRSYKLNIQYLVPDNDATLQVDVNGINTGEIYTLPKTNSLNYNDFKMFTIGIDLEQGKNKVKFYNKVNLIAPFIGALTYTAQRIINYTNATKGTLDNGAVLVLNNTMVGGLDNQGGAVTIEIETPSTGKYLISIQCATDVSPNSVLAVEINHIRTIGFKVLKTGINSLNDAINYEIITDLFEGINEIKFFNPTNMPGAYVGDVQIILITPYIINGNATQGLLYNGASFTERLTAQLGGSNGLLKIFPYVIFNGKYNVSFNYIANNGRNVPINIYINNQLIGAKILSGTNNNTFNSYNLLANFNGDGNDIISFSNYTAVNSLEIGSVIFEKSMFFYKLYGIQDVDLFDGAIVSDDLILGVGENSGILTFTVDAPEDGKYDLTIYYVAEDNNKYSNIEVNWVELDKIYNFNQTNSMNISDVKFIVVTIDLFQGRNIIKIYNNGKQLSSTIIN